MTQTFIYAAAGAVLGLLLIGFYGLMISRNLIKVIICLQVLGKGAMLAMIFAGNVTRSATVGQSMALTVIVVDTIVAVVALAMAVQIRKKFGTLDTKCLANLKG